MNYLNKKWKQIPILHPNIWIKLVWDFCILLIISFAMLIFSLDLSFYHPFTDTLFLELCNYFIPIFLFLDIVLKFKTSFYEYGVIVKNNKKIALNYLKTSFLADFLSVLVAILYFGALKNTFFEWIILVFAVKLKNLKEIIKNFENLIEIGEIYELLAIMFKMVCIAHIYACMWHFISFINKNEENNWIHSKNLQLSEWYERYIYSFYWALTTMVTVGYGDITPSSELETIFCSFSLLTGSLVFGYCFNRIGALISRQDERNEELRF